ncbi:MAG: class I SAM-dependent methyltransferase, partial [Patescibacteria group bacterium]|nr:class I SAM-dependent methyltransferase [Patescibacteria group bacterium]
MCSDSALPSVELLCEQAAWLAPARSRLLRRVGIATRQHVLDVASGPGAVTSELASRCAVGGIVVALDRSRAALAHIASPAPAMSGGETAARTYPIQADACRLPFPDGTFDLAF